MTAPQPPAVPGPALPDPALRGPALLFCPADRPDRYEKALAAADGVILDLEDGTGANAKDAARAALLASPLDPARVIVRINAIGTAEHAADIEALRQTGYRMLMLPKTETTAQLASLGSRWQVIALCETPAGILNAAQIAAAPAVTAVMWGAEDLIASLGGRSSRHAAVQNAAGQNAAGQNTGGQNTGGQYRDVALYARSTTLLAASAYGKAAIDSVYLNIGDLDGLSAEAQDAAASGFALKACIHPSQVAVVRAAFRADDTQVAWARRVIDAVRASAGQQDSGAIKVDGQMVDAPVIRQAEAILASVR